MRTKKNYRIIQIIKNRRTVRKFYAKRVPVSILKVLIDAARWAPCPNNVQPWKFFICKHSSNITAKVIKHLEKKLAIKNIGISVFLRDAIKILKEAPVSIYIFNTGILSKRFKVLGRFYQKKGNLFEHQAISAAIENLLLSAEGFELGAVWLGSPVFASKGIERIFETDFELCAIIAMGYYGKKPHITNRLPLAEITTFL